MQKQKPLECKNKTLKKEIEEDIRKWNTSHVHGLSELIL
jgi:hypothetical protein